MGVVAKVVIAVLAVSLPIVSGGPLTAQPKSDKPIVVGGLFSATGGIAAVGLSQRTGALLAQKVINARGGINGRPLQLIVEDDASNPDTSVTKINAFLQNKDMVAVVGPSFVGASVAVGALTQPAGLPLVAWAGLGPDIERQRTCVFHISPTQSLNARALLAYAKQAGFKKTGVLHDSGYGQVVFNSMKEFASQFGVEFVAVEKFEISATDATAQAAKIRAANPEAIFVLGVSPIPVRNLRQIRVNVPIIAAIATALYETAKAMGTAADNVIHAELVIAEDPQPYQVEFIEAFKKEYGYLPKNYEAHGWDGVMALAEVLQRLGDNITREGICKEMRRPYQGVASRYDFSAPDLNGVTIADFNYSILNKGVFSRLPFKASD